MSTPFIGICAWCGHVLQEEDTRYLYGVESHGICGPCADNVIRELELQQLEAQWRVS